MKHTVTRWLGLTAAAAVLAAGCAGGAARNNMTNPVPGAVSSSTTGDADACAAALGNVSQSGFNWGGTRGWFGTTRDTAANGILIGNVALVALPTTETAGATSGAGTTTAGMGTPAPNGTTPRPAAPGTNQTTNRTRWATGPLALRDSNGGTRVAANAADSALARIRTACTRVAEIRLVNNADDRRRLAEIATSIRSGQPVSRFMEELSGIIQRATVSPATAAPGRTTPATPTPPTTPAAPGANVAPGTTGTTGANGTTSAPGGAGAPR